MIHRWKQRDAITAARLNSMVAPLVRLDDQSRFGKEPSPSVPNAVPIKCTVVSIHNDHLICRPLNQTNASADFPVAKPWSLRMTPFDGESLPWIDGVLYSYSYTDEQSRTVTNTDDSSTEDQVIVPRYVQAQTVGETDYTGSQLTVQRVAGGTGVTYEDSASGYTVTVEFEDMNRDARGWFKVAE